MARDGFEASVLNVCELVNRNEYGVAAIALQSIHNPNVLNSSDLVTSLIFMEQTACHLLKDCFNKVNTISIDCLKFIEQVGLFNQYIAMLNTNENTQIDNQHKLLLHNDILTNFVTIVDTLVQDKDLHHENFVFSLCTWLEAIAHFVHRHDNLFREIVQPLRQSILACVLSDSYGMYLRNTLYKKSPARAFFIRTCSLVMGVFQSNTLSFENALKTSESYKNVISIGEQIFKRYLTDFRQYLLNQVNDIKSDFECLTGICLLMTNCYNYEAFINDNDYFNFILHLLNTDFVRKGLLPTWTNDNTILADTLMVQLKNASNDSNIRLFLQQEQAVNVIHYYMDVEYDRLRIQTCMLLGVLLKDVTIKKLQIRGDKLTRLYFDAILQAHNSLNKCYKRVPIHMLLRALAALVHNETIQISIATEDNYFDNLLSIIDDYNIVYDIFWTLSFNRTLHGKFNSHKSFIEQLQMFLEKRDSVLDKDTVRAAEGILWNLTDQNNATASSQKPVPHDDKENTATAK